MGIRSAGKLVAVLAVAVSTLAVARPVLAAGDSLSIDPVTTTASVGDSFTVTVLGTSAGPVSGTQASLVFDPTELQITALAKGTDWVENGAGFAGYPGLPRMAAFIASANAAGEIPAIAAYFSDGPSNMPAGDHDLYSVTFTAIACGDSSLDLPIGPADGTMIDGNSATYGNALGDVISASGDVDVPCASGSVPGQTTRSASVEQGQAQAMTYGSCPTTVSISGSPIVYQANLSAELPFEYAKSRNDRGTDPKQRRYGSGCFATGNCAGSGSLAASHDQRGRQLLLMEDRGSRDTSPLPRNEEVER